jgi:predicted amidophosphoribosyltransferase
MLLCQICKRPLGFPWKSPCSACLRPSRLKTCAWQSAQIEEGRSSCTLTGTSYLIFKKWKSYPTPRLNDWIRQMIQGSEVQEWLLKNADYLIPMPQRASRSLELGHWPALHLTRILAPSTAGRIIHPLLPHGSGRQAPLRLRERSSRSLQFELQTPYRDWVKRQGARNWLLVDDLRTTGNTLESAATALRLHGAKGKILAWTFGFKPILAKTPGGELDRGHSHPLRTRSHRGPEHPLRA